MMEVTVATSRGRQVLALDPSWTVSQLKEELHSRLASLQVPIPEEQRLICAKGNFLESSDKNAPISAFCHAGDSLVILPRRRIPADADESLFPPKETTPAATQAQVNAAIREENQRLAAAGVPPLPEAPTPAQPPIDAADQLEGSIRALVEGNFEQLRGYLEELQEVVQRGGIDEDMMFAVPGEMDEDEDEEEEEEEEGGDGEGGAAAAPAAPAPVQIPEVEQAPLNELLAMGFPDQLSRNALLLHRNRLQPAVEWALTHVDDPAATEPLTDDVLQAVYGRGQGAGGAAGGARRRPRLPPGQVDPEALDQMVEMGFNRDDSARALAFTANRLEAACQLLLTGMPLPPLPPQRAAQTAAAAGEAAAPAEGGEAAAGAGGAEAAEAEAGEEEHDDDDGGDMSDSEGDDDDDHDGDEGPLYDSDVDIGGLPFEFGGIADMPGVEWMGYSDEEDEEFDDEDEEEYEDFEEEFVEPMEGEEGEGGGGQHEQGGNEAPAAGQPGSQEQPPPPPPGSQQ